ncbi:DUF2442 domain-containing protein [Thiococcus pfennigii]|jgi:hypothetical protein|uniref:DUF2442 domain-containing protein n=1 Tax=Thiococcus pfennigii TaxID=1057 RepID=UPI0019034DD7|nr:DUF2442 domain-containing protein [Thiococcus pfennigii]MBK1733500.1 hypothetical protein [Thiococcus pfennigii]
MKLIDFEQKAGFEFSLTFENREIIMVDLEPLIGKRMSAEDLGSAEIDSEWGCLQFLGGEVDIEPTTLYRFAHGGSNTQAA